MTTRELGKITDPRDLQFQAILDLTYQLIGVLDSDGNLLFANRAALESVHTDLSAVLGKPFWETPWWTHSQTAQAQVKDAIRRARMGEFVRFETDHMRPDGSLMNIDFSLKPIFDEEGNVGLLIPEGRDISDRLKLQAAQVAKEAAEASNRIKSEFLAKVSHELRTPLNAIIGFSEFILSQGPDKIEKTTILRYLADIHESGERMLELVTDILEISMIEEGKRRIEFGMVDLHDLLRECVKLSQSLARERGVTLNLSATTPHPKAYTDRRAVTEIVLNLISNGLKYTKNGGSVTVTLRATDNASEIEVKDTGIGIEPDALPCVTEMFRQADAGAYRAHPGAGLGLAIVASLANLLNAKLNIESEKGKGTVVTVKLPIQPINL